MTALPEGAVAHWDFTRGPGLSDLLCPARKLQHSPENQVSWHADATTGGCMVFRGDGGHLRLAASEVGNLDMAAVGKVTVAALVRRDDHRTGFIAGLWQEDDLNPRRQYGMFIDLPVYGGGDQVVGHVSRSGGPSPNLPYSRDYAASARMVRPGGWRVVAFNYDGDHVTAYLDGIADPRPAYREPDRPLGEGLRYAKNPFHFDEGLFAGPLADFTVGAVLLSEGIGNAFCGGISQLAIWDRALGADEIKELAASWNPPSVPLAVFDWWRKEPAPDSTSGGEDGKLWSVESMGVRHASSQQTPARAAPSQLIRDAATNDANVEFPLLPSARYVRIEATSDSSRVDVILHDQGLTKVLKPESGSLIWRLPERSADAVLHFRFGAGEALTIGAVKFLQ